MKLLLLCLLITGNRGQTMKKLDINCMTKTDEFYRFSINSLIKQSAPGRPQPDVEFRPYPNDTSLCVYTCMTDYLNRTENIRASTTQLFISYVKPHAAVSRDTLSRWVKVMLHAAGIDTSVYKPHSTRAASTSAACRMDTSVDTILKTAGWKSECMFAKYYHKEIVAVNNYASNVLSVVAN